MTDEQLEDKIIEMLKGRMETDPIPKEQVNKFFEALHSDKINHIVVENRLFHLTSKKIVTDYWVTKNLRLTPKGYWILENIRNRGMVYRKNKKIEKRFWEYIKWLIPLIISTAALICSIISNHKASHNCQYDEYYHSYRY